MYWVMPIFRKNNLLFRNSLEQVGSHIVEQAASHAHNISDAIDIYGQSRVETVLDAALALEQYIDIHMGLHRPLFPVYEKQRDEIEVDPFFKRFDTLIDENPKNVHRRTYSKIPIPPHPETDLLWFIAHYGPELEEWERDIFLSVRQESFYFYPVFACQIMNEGWACLWHTTLLREADFLPDDLFLDAMKTHSDVVRPFAGDRQVALSLNPYHLGFAIWNNIIEEMGINKAREIMRQDDDFGFIRNYLTEDLANKLNLFQYKQIRKGEYEVVEKNLDTLKEGILADKFNFGAPSIHVKSILSDGTLSLHHEHKIDNRGLDLVRTEKVLGYIQSVWRRPVKLQTVDDQGHAITCSA